MTWWGMGIGAGLGLLLGGPIGALIGASIGSWVSRGVSVGGTGRAQQRQTVFLVGMFSMLGKMAQADQVLDRNEINMVNRFITEGLRLDPASQRMALQIFNSAKNSSNTIYEYADQFAEVFRQEREIRVSMYRALFDMALADGTMHPNEDKILQQMPRRLLLEQQIYEQMRLQYSSSSQSSSSPRSQHGLQAEYALLDCSPQATDEEIKRSYRKKCADYHPDTLAAKGLPEGFEKFAEEQFKKINRAYETIMQART